MPELIYGLCAITAFLCAWLLLKAYRTKGNILLFWSGLFFVIQTLNNFFLVVDKVIFPQIDLGVFRHGVAFIAIVVLLYGMITTVEGE
jgi:hypothetical protein